MPQSVYGHLLPEISFVLTFIKVYIMNRNHVDELFRTFLSKYYSYFDYPLRNMMENQFKANMFVNVSEEEDFIFGFKIFFGIIDNKPMLGITYEDYSDEIKIIDYKAILEKIKNIHEDCRILFCDYLKLDCIFIQNRYKEYLIKRLDILTFKKMIELYNFKTKTNSLFFICLINLSNPNINLNNIFESLFKAYIDIINKNIKIKKEPKLLYREFIDLLNEVRKRNLIDAYTRRHYNDKWRNNEEMREELLEELKNLLRQ